MEFYAKTFDELTAAEVYEILKARAAVFVMEQNIHYLDMDDIDYDSLHCFMCQGKRVTAYLRAYITDDKSAVRVGRVLTLERGKGCGRMLMTESITAIKRITGYGRIQIDAQKQAVGFYEKLGFKVISNEFLEEGIVHLKMEIKI